MSEWLDRTNLTPSAMLEMRHLQHLDRVVEANQIFGEYALATPTTPAEWAEADRQITAAANAAIVASRDAARDACRSAVERLVEAYAAQPFRGPSGRLVSPVDMEARAWAVVRPVWDQVATWAPNDWGVYAATPIGDLEAAVAAELDRLHRFVEAVTSA